MSHRMNLSLPAQLKSWVDAQAKAGGYEAADEFVRDLLRRARERQLRRQIDAMLIEAVESGANVVMDDTDWKSIRSAARSQASKSRRTKR